MQDENETIAEANLCWNNDAVETNVVQNEQSAVSENDDNDAEANPLAANDNHPKEDVCENSGQTENQNGDQSGSTTQSDDQESSSDDDGNRQHVCSWCGRTFSKETLFLAHRDDHSNMKLKYSCPACTHVYAELRLLNEHAWKVHGLKGDQVLTKMSKINLRNAATMKMVPGGVLGRQERVRSQKESGQKDFEPQVERKLQRQLKRKTKLGGERPKTRGRPRKYMYRCDTCKFAAATEHHLKQHSVKCQKIRSSISHVRRCAPCHLCGRPFRSVEKREAHVHNHNNIVYVCRDPLCGYQYKRVEELRSHLEYWHNCRLLQENVGEFLINPEAQDSRQDSTPEQMDDETADNEEETPDNESTLPVHELLADVNETDQIDIRNADHEMSPNAHQELTV